ncbi:Serine protease, partial [Globisporangium splendens]
MAPRKLWAVAAAVALLCGSVVAIQGESDAGSDLVVDARGLAFASAQAFCAYHCKKTHFAYRRRLHGAASECSEERCGEYMDAGGVVQRALMAAQNDAANGSESEDSPVTVKASQSPDEEEDSVERVNFLSCQSVAQSDMVLAFEMKRYGANASVFQGFHEAFFSAFDAMVTSVDATYDACQLEFLQQKFLPTANESSATLTTKASGDDSTKKPMLVKLHVANTDQRQCVEHVKTIWTNDDEAMTPFLSRADQSAASATIMLVHINASIAERINALECIDSVLELPAILKLMPFARSARQLSMHATQEAPALEVRLLKGSDQQEVFERLQTNFKQINGVVNAFELPGDNADRPLSLFTKALDEMETWSHAVALALTDADVEWIDVKETISQNSFRGSIYAYAMGLHDEKQQHRRLDAYVQSLVGVENAKSQGISGNNITVGITDSGLYIDHDQFDQTSRNMYGSVDASARKVVYYNPWANRYDESADVTCGHGTHVAGILAGSSFSGQNSDLGIANSAKIAFMDIGAQSASCAGQSGCGVSLATPADAGDLLRNQIAVGARIFSFSWGTPGSDYSSQARDLDAFIYANPDVLVIVAAGNSGESSTTGQNTISSPSGAKNVISVGASLNAAASFTTLPCPDVFNQYSVASFSSAGPTSDGRMKPDVVAPGMIITSSKSEQPGSTVKTADTCDLQGTSQATPVVTGLAVLLYEWLRDGWWKAGVKDSAYGMTNVPAALLKALIIHSGDPLRRRLAAFDSGPISCSGIERRAWGLTYPDVYQGYGKPNMTNIAEFGITNSTPTLYFLPNSTEGSEPSVAHEREVKISFTVPRGVDLRATLVWTDPPGSIRATTQLQHDLDLTVQIRNSNQTFHPLTASNSTQRDERNNVEMVQVSYAQLLAAAQSEANSSELIGANGEIIVDAVIYGRSVMLARTQAFAFVASSSVIGTAIGAAATDNNAGSDSIWTPYMVAGVAVGAIVLLMLIACIVRCCARRGRRHETSRAPGAAAAGYPGGAVIIGQQPIPNQPYYAHSTPAGGVQQPYDADRCPYCLFATPDAVVMVNHVEAMHSDGNMQQAAEGANFGLPQVSPAPNAYPPPPPPGPQYHNYDPRHNGAMQREPREDERCPYCTFVSADPVILVNHVQHVHGQ